MNIRLQCFLVISVILGIGGLAHAQKDQDLQKPDDFSQQLNLNIFKKPTLGEGGLDQFNSSDPSELAVTLDPPEGLKTGDTVTLKVKVTLAPGWYTYSQNPNFSGRSVIKLAKSEGVVPLGKEFVPDHEPKLVLDETFGELEKFYKEVTWSRKYRVQPGVTKISLAGTIDYQTCNDQCVPHAEEFSVSADVEATETAPTLASYSLHGRPLYNEEPGPVALTFRLSPEDAQPGETVEMTVRMRLDKGWHTYAQSQEEPGGTPVRFDLQSFQGLRALDEGFRADRAPEVKQVELTKTLTVEQQFFEDEVTWTRTFEVTEDAAETGFGIQGVFQYQVCTDKKCLRPEEFPFAVGELSAALPISELPSAALGGFSLDHIDVEPPSGSLGVYLVYAFLGGLILNVMPCVLPVLAIKILSFVKQAGESRSRIFQLNLAYSAGVVAVFLCLATLAMSLELSWGGLFQMPEFNLVMACLVFVMGLSLLGVFEIPIPGLAGGGGQQEGLPGAFLTGIFATFLATPCTGPLMGATLGWSVRQPPHIIYLVWGMMGVGMAFPYLLAGLFPSVIRWLPKPGNWMVRFKELSGFALMGAVIWIISFTNTYLIVPALIMMMGLAIGFWMVGNLYDPTTHIRHKMTVRAVAALVTGYIVYFGFSQIPELEAPVAAQENQQTSPGEIASGSPDGGSRNVQLPQNKSHGAHGAHSLPWQDFSEDALQQALRQKKTVLIDFSADWCLTCKQNERQALNTPNTLAMVTEREVVTLYADFTNKSPYLQGLLNKFGSIGVPLTVIFPGNNPKKPLILPGLYTESTLLEKLGEATKSQKTAMNQASIAE